MWGQRAPGGMVNPRVHGGSLGRWKAPGRAEGPWREGPWVEHCVAIGRHIWKAALDVMLRAQGGGTTARRFTAL